MRLAVRSLNANKPRALLTMLGISIGIASVITLVAVGTGVQKYITDQFSSAGTNLVAVVPGQLQRGGGPPGQGAPLTMADYRAIINDVNGITGISADFSRVGDLQIEGKTSEVNVTGVASGYQEVRNWRPDRGRFLEESDNQSRARVVVLGQTVVNDLFNGDDPIDRIVRINNQNFRVVGVMQAKGSSFVGDQDAVAFVPLETAQDRLFAQASRINATGERIISNIYIQAADDRARENIKTDVTSLLRTRHRIPSGEDNDFTVVTSGELINSFGAVLGVLTAFLGAIAAISLVVGGIGIMNIMLVSVTERTREIGLRKAIGARSGSILSQFLVEAMFLSLLGGIFGVLMGVGGAWLIGKAASLTPIVELRTIGLAVGFSLAVGLFFGIYPARRASKLVPVEALRFE